jgi:benzoylformate decarboxylase
MFGHHSASLLGDADAVIAVGTYLFPEVFPSLSTPFRPGTPVIHIGLDAGDIARNFPVDVGIAANPRWTLAALTAALDERMTEEDKAAARARLGAAAAPGAAAASGAASAPGSVLEAVCLAVTEQTAGNLAVFDEAITASPVVARHVPRDEPGSYFLTRSRSLGVGLPGAVGVKVARPGQQVVCFSGDGAAMYTFQALWTAARYGIGAKFVICHNGRYHILDRNIQEYWRESGITPHDSPDSFDISFPDISFTGLARALGVRGARVEKPEEAAGAVAAMLADDGPFLLDVLTDAD